MQHLVAERRGICRALSESQGHIKTTSDKHPAAATYALFLEHRHRPNARSPLPLFAPHSLLCLSFLPGFSLARGVVLKAVTDVHFSAVVSVRCCAQGGGGSGNGLSGGGSSDPAAITADMEGVVNKMAFRRVMWTKWVVDTECLLDGEIHALRERRSLL